MNNNYNNNNKFNKANLIQIHNHTILFKNTKIKINRIKIMNKIIRINKLLN